MSGRLRVAAVEIRDHVLAEALDGLLVSREAEGAKLGAVLAALVDQVEALCAEAEVEAAGQGPAIRDRFAKRLAELLGEATEPLRAPDRMKGSADMWRRRGQPEEQPEQQQVVQRPARRSAIRSTAIRPKPRH